MKRFRILPLILAPCLFVFLAVGVAQATLNIGTNFTAQTLSGEPALNPPGYGLIPPDTDGAVGPNHIVELINGAYAVYTKSGGFITSLGQDDFWRKEANITPTGTYPFASFDPRVVYDPFATSQGGRWYASSLDRGTGGINNNFLLAVSKTSNPLDGWTGFKISGAPATTATGFFTDFDTLGFNKDQVYLTSNNLPHTKPNTNPVTTSILAVPKASLLAGNINNLTRFDNLNANDTGSAIQPLIDPNGSGIENLYSAYNTPAGLLKYSQLLGTTSSPTLNTATQFISATAYDEPPKAKQQGGHNNIETGDNRFGSSVVKGGDGKVWAVQNVESDHHAALRWVQIDPITNKLLQEGLIAKDGYDYYYGSIAVNSKGTVVIGFSGSSLNTFISAYAVEGTTDLKDKTTFGDAILLKAGTSTYHITFGGGRNRWGDYSATWVDPEDDNIFWTFQEWASDTDPYFGGHGTWSTQITELNWEEDGTGGNQTLLDPLEIPLITTQARAESLRLPLSTTPAPLPSTLLFLGSGLLGLVGWRSFRKA